MGRHLACQCPLSQSCSVPPRQALSLPYTEPRPTSIKKFFIHALRMVLSSRLNNPIEWVLLSLQMRPNSKSLTLRHFPDTCLTRGRAYYLYQCSLHPLYIHLCIYHSALWCLVHRSGLFLDGGAMPCIFMFVFPASGRVPETQ